MTKKVMCPLCGSYVEEGGECQLCGYKVKKRRRGFRSRERWKKG